MAKRRSKEAPATEQRSVKAVANQASLETESLTIRDDERVEGLKQLQAAYDSKQLTVYIGAGVSIESGLPSWEQLVLSMYFQSLRGDDLSYWRPFPNYLFAISEWYLKHNGEPLDVVARKIKLHYKSDNPAFMRLLRETLYAGFVEQFSDRIDGDLIRSRNQTLDAVARLCESSGRRHGVKSVVSYNYDDLLETAIGARAEPVWSTQQRITSGVPVYHVHGFVPFSTTSQTRSGESEIVFTEDQYFQVAQNPYSWSNVVQIQSMSSTVGLMIGLSLSDRNIRRLLQAVNSTPLRSECYLLIKRRSHPSPSPEDIDGIDSKAVELSNRFPGGRKKRERFRYEISEILQAVSALDEEQQIQLLHDMGVHPWWVDDYSEIGRILDQIANGHSSERGQRPDIGGEGEEG